MDLEGFNGCIGLPVPSTDCAIMNDAGELLPQGEVGELVIRGPQVMRLRALGVTGVTRSSLFPDVPTIAEAALPGYEMTGWAGIMGPAGMRREIVDALNIATGRTLLTLEIKDRLQGLGVEPAGSTPEALAKKYAEWVDRFGKIARRAAIVPQ